MEAAQNPGTENAPVAPALTELQDYLAGEKFDIEILVDVSGSMKTGTRLADALEIGLAASRIAELVDEDGGVGVQMFSNYPSDQKWEDLKGSGIKEAFANARVGGGTETLKFLEEEIAQHYDRKGSNPTQRTLIVCITDGEPAGGNKEMAQIKARLAEVQKGIDFTQRVPELKILMWQVGDDEGARKFLQDLDNDDEACGLLVESVFDGKDARSVEEVFRDAIREHLHKN